MENNENQVRSLFEPNSNTTTTATVTANGLFGNSDDGSHSQPNSAPEKKKRGRPRKYETPEQAAAARKAAIAAASAAAASAAASGGAPSFQPPIHTKKPRSFDLGNAGQCFTPHLVTVAAGEDVGHKIMLFIQQNGREMCVLSASGTISNPVLRQPATSGGNISYEGQFHIVSLTGSYVRNEVGGRSGGLSVCLSNSDGQLVGGSIAGPLRAAGPVQVIVGTFLIDPIKDTSAGNKGDVSITKLPQQTEPAVSLGFRQAVDSSGGNTIRGNEEPQAIGGNHFMFHHSLGHVPASHPVDWGSPDSRNVGFELTGRTGHGGHQSPENGDYDQLTD